MEVNLNLDLSSKTIEKILEDFNNQKKQIKSVTLSNEEVVKKIDHTLLKPDATEDEIKVLCEEAKKYGFASVCINPFYVPLCSKLLSGSEVKVCTVIGFPLGATTSEIKLEEAVQAVSNGAEEIDMVINVGQLKSKNYEYIFNDIYQVVQAGKKGNAITKVIIETALLTEKEKVIACLIAKKAGANFVKTSTGFAKGGATLEDVSLMKFIVGDSVSVKASGGIRTREDTELMIAHGADRIGASAGIKIVTSKKGEGGY